MGIVRMADGPGVAGIMFPARRRGMGGLVRPIGGMRGTSGFLSTIRDAAEGYFGDYGPLTIKTGADRGIVHGMRGTRGWEDILGGVVGQASNYYFGGGRDGGSSAPPAPIIVVQQPAPQPAADKTPKWLLPVGLIGAGAVALAIFSNSARRR